MTSRFKDLEKNAEANFGQQQRVFLSEKVQEAQRHSLIHEATADTRQEWVLSQLRMARMEEVSSVLRPGYTDLY